MASRLRISPLFASGLTLFLACATDPIPKPAPPPPAPLASVASPTATAAPMASAAPVPSGPATAAPPRAVTPSTKEWETNRPTSWTDERVVAALAQSCDFTPSPPPPPDEQFPPEDIFACKLPFEQTCFTTPCTDESGACRAGCESTCGSCNASCSSACGPCEAACKDEPCRLACAKTTARCKQSCARAMDRCASGTCAKADEACTASLYGSLKGGRCTGPCGAYDRCWAACKDEPCQKACGTSLAPAFEGCLAACNAAGGTDLAKAQCARHCSEKSPCNYRTCSIP